jgi:uncharacterized protein
MPRKFFRRWVPTSKALGSRKSLRILNPLLKEPNLFHLNRHSVSVAMFAGIFTAFLPIPGQTLVAALLALLLRANLPLCIALIWITNPLTMGPIFYLTFELGRWILGSPPMAFHFQPTWEWFEIQGEHLLAPLFTGSVITGVVLGTIGYVVMNQLWRWQVVKSWEERKTRRQRKLKELIRNGAHLPVESGPLSKRDKASPENSTQEPPR